MTNPHIAITHSIACCTQRVGIVRKLRWGVSLKKDAPGAYRLDMTTQRFKNSRFYGPSVTSISSMIAPMLDKYIELIAFEFEQQPYVFSMKDPLRCQTSSQWSAYCKSIFKRWSGVACPPKMLVRTPGLSLHRTAYAITDLPILPAARVICDLDSQQRGKPRCSEASGTRHAP